MERSQMPAIATLTCVGWTACVIAKQCASFSDLAGFPTNDLAALVSQQRVQRSGLRHVDFPLAGVNQESLQANIWARPRRRSLLMSAK